MVACTRALVAMVIFGAVAHAGDPGRTLADDPDVEVAHRYYDEGARFYQAGQYQEAIAQFEKARSVKAAPGLDYNIARAYDRLGNVDHALAEYRRYLDSQPPDAGQIRERITVLEQRASAAKPQAPAQEAPRTKRAWVYAVAGVAAAVVVGVAVGVGVGLGTRQSDPSPQLGAVHW
jgi:tetratricopeptide (TPR) repeat protein